MYFDDILTSNNNPFGVLSCNALFIFDRPITYKTVKYTDQFNYATTLGMFPGLNESSLIAGVVWYLD
jgi:hypothetical protein